MSPQLCEVLDDANEYRVEEDIRYPLESPFVGHEIFDRSYRYPINAFQTPLKIDPFKRYVRS